jgi:pimeloyl-ACP methyl ester carboxylesterase
MKKTKLVALVCAFLSGVSGFTSGMQGESSQKNEKDLKNGASTKDENQKSIKQMIISGLNNPYFKKYGKRTLYGGGSTLGVWGLLKYVGNSILYPGVQPIVTENIQVRVPLGYNIGEDLTPNPEQKLSYYTLSGSLTYNNTVFEYNQAITLGNFEYFDDNNSWKSAYNDKALKEKLKDCDGIVICFGGNAANAISAKPSNVENKLVLAINLPGYGSSEKKWKNDKILQNYANQCLDCAKIFSKHLTEKNNLPVTVSGWDLGGYAASYLTKFEGVKKCILYAPVVLSKVNPFVKLVRPIVFGYDLDSIENLKNSNKDCQIFLASGTLNCGDFLSLERTVLGKSVQEVTKQQPNEQGNFQDDALTAAAKEVRKAILDSRNEGQNGNKLEERLFVRLLNQDHCFTFLSDDENDFVKPSDQ